MDLGRIPLFALAMDRMAWLDRRQQVLAQNIANADTPNFAPSDVKPFDIAKAVGRSGAGALLQPGATNPMHLGGAVSEGAAAVAVEHSRNPYESTPSGNAVVLEEQMMKVAETQADYQMATSLYRKYMDMLKLAIGRGGA